MPTLAELLAMPADDRPESTTTVTLIQGQHLLKEAKRLDDERTDLLIQEQRSKSDEDDGKARTRKMGQAAKQLSQQLEKNKTDAEALQGRLAALQGEVGLRGMDPGEWQRYKDAHPPRENSRDDRQWTGGWCNATDLLNDLGQFVVSWDGEHVPDGDAVIMRIAPSDRSQLVHDVVAMHQDRLPRIPKAPISPSTASDATD